MPTKELAESYRVLPNSFSNRNIRRSLWGHQACDIVCVSSAPSVVLPLGPRNCVSVGEGGDPSLEVRVGFAGAHLETLFSMQLFGAQISPKGQPKVSIVANLAPNMTPKWNPKWTQSDNGRPLRNMHRHCHIVHLAPLWELYFRSRFRVPQKVTQTPTIKRWKS